MTARNTLCPTTVAKTQHNPASIRLEVPNELLSQAHNYTEMDFFALSHSDATINGDATQVSDLSEPDYHDLAVL